MATLTLPTLESHLWQAANILRGSPVDRTDWKGYILPLMFFKRICDVWDEEYHEAVQTYGEDFVDEHRFQIPEGCHWDDVRETASNVGAALQNAMRGIESANQEHLYGVFGDAQWTNKDRLPDAILKDLIEQFSKLNLGNQNVTSDIIGDGYEYLIKKFADATNNKAGEFYTPRSVVRLMVDILNPKEGETVYDPACGTGGMLLGAVAHVRERGGDPRTFYGTGLAACVLILKKKKTKERKNKVLIVDASSLMRKGRAQNYLDPEHTDQIAAWVRQFEDARDRARAVTLSQIQAENWTLNISRYVLPPTGEDIPPLDVAIQDFKSAWGRAQEAEAKLRTLLNDGGWLNG
ncbi:MAG: type I restriction-modification system subunit M [Chloroflexota bacterium]